jgi:hypothetical protein
VGLKEGFLRVVRSNEVDFFLDLRWIFTLNWTSGHLKLNSGSRPVSFTPVTNSRAVIVRTVSPIKRKDGSTVGFDDNACVLVDKKGQPVGNRVLGVVAQEVRTKGWGKITALAPKVV